MLSISICMRCASTTDKIPIISFSANTPPRRTIAHNTPHSPRLLSIVWQVHFGLIWQTSFSLSFLTLCVPLFALLFDKLFHFCRIDCCYRTASDSEFHMNSTLQFVALWRSQCILVHAAATAAAATAQIDDDTNTCRHTIASTRIPLIETDIIAFIFDLFGCMLHSLYQRMDEFFTIPGFTWLLFPATYRTYWSKWCDNGKSVCSNRNCSILIPPIQKRCLSSKKKNTLPEYVSLLDFLSRWLVFKSLRAITGEKHFRVFSIIINNWFL